MASDNTYGTVFGFIQKFGEKDAIVEKEVNGQTIREFTVKSITSGKLVRVTLWPEIEEGHLAKGVLVAAEGKTKIDEGKDGKKYYSLTAYTITTLNPWGRSEAQDEVVNRQIEDPAVF